MVSPSTLISALINILFEKTELILNEKINFKEISEADSKLLPPSVALWADFDDEALLADDTTPVELPCSIYALCKSGKKQTSAEAFNEALTMAVKVMQLLKGDYNLNNCNNELEFIRLDLQKHPVVIIEKSLSCTLQVNFTYTIYNPLEA